jgi:hypothetical protein
MNFRSDLKKFDTTNSKFLNIKTKQEKTTNINILLNRVRFNKKKELKNKIFFTSLVVLTVTLIGIFSLI